MSRADDYLARARAYRDRLTSLLAGEMSPETISSWSEGETRLSQDLEETARRAREEGIPPDGATALEGVLREIVEQRTLLRGRLEEILRKTGGALRGVERERKVRRAYRANRPEKKNP